MPDITHRQECEDVKGYVTDPLAEQSQNPVNGVIHKYNGRLLLVVSGTCAVNCRFCFRRHFPYGDNQLGGDNLQKAIDYIASDTSIREVILSGGDPLAANDRRLQKLALALNEIEHLETLRIHTRLPIMIPQRINSDMLKWFTGQRLKPVMVIHCNHPQEIDESVVKALDRLRSAGVILLNQTVLLRGINDATDILVKLSNTLFQAGVLPYYLHLLDPVQGAAHFDVSEETGKTLIEGILKQCPGYLVPRLVREIPGHTSKTPIT